MMQEADGRISSNSFSKLVQNERYIIGYAGAVGQCQRVVQWILGGFKDADGDECMPYISDRENPAFEVVFIDKLDGRIYTVEGPAFDIIEVEYPYACGSGSSYALGYLYGRRLDTPKIAKRAVRAASHYDSQTGGRIEVIEVNLMDED